MLVASLIALTFGAVLFLAYRNKVQTEAKLLGSTEEASANPFDVAPAVSEEERVNSEALPDNKSDTSKS